MGNIYSSNHTLQIEKERRGKMLIMRKNKPGCLNVPKKSEIENKGTELKCKAPKGPETPNLKGFQTHKTVMNKL